MLKVENINTYYGTSHILHNVSLEVQDGEIVVLLGRNGVGKSTTLKSIMGIAPSKSGKITLNGEEITRLTPDKIARRGISFVPEDRRVIPNLTVFENLKLGMLIRGKNVNMNETLETVFQYFPKLKERLNQMGESLSGGEQQKINEKTMKILKRVQLAASHDRVASTLSHGEKKYLEIGIALATDPKLLLLDEPTAGMSPAETILATELIRGLRDKLSLTIVLVEHDMSVVMKISDEVLCLNEGRVLACGSPNEISCNEEVQRVYLGGRKEC